jgi:hypothetical protein
MKDLSTPRIDAARYHSEYWHEIGMASDAAFPPMEELDPEFWLQLETGRAVMRDDAALLEALADDPT